MLENEKYEFEDDEIPQIEADDNAKTFNSDFSTDSEETQ